MRHTTDNHTNAALAGAGLIVLGLCLASCPREVHAARQVPQAGLEVKKPRVCRLWTMLVPESGELVKPILYCLDSKKPFTVKHWTVVTARNKEGRLVSFALVWR
jgi:hypothetical protein